MRMQIPAPLYVLFRLLPILAVLLSPFFLAFAHPALSETERASGFSPTWKALRSEEKQQFLAGYIWGWKDAAKVNDITVEYIEKNPQKALEGLRSIRSLYNMTDVKPEELSHLLDEYFANPENQQATLSAAVSAVKSQAK
jgi:hypothetical protein